MPELPEVECVRRSLLPHVLGRRVDSVRIYRPGVCDCRDAQGKKRPASPARLLEGATVESILRHGKQLAMVASTGGVVCVHLGMTGLMCVSHAQRDATAHGRHDHVVWTLAGGRKMTFHDPRRFGGLWAFPSQDSLRATRWSALGPDALTITGGGLYEALGGSGRAVKAGLLDQSAVAGVGNIYADESLFGIGMDPRTRCARVRLDRWEALAAEVRRVLSAAIEHGGSTVRNYVNADGSAGSAQTRHAVYGRGGLACVRCAGTLCQGVVGQRTTVWCPRCQGRG
ncbi:MAG: bifunctional DNA-formamidopyrimidine glycosylase/DNA-(apurinic or apyrimidinic site) lyase [Phycisphaerales bacterium]